MAVSKKSNERRAAERKARADSFIHGNRKERRAAKAAHMTPVDTPVTDELKAKAKAKAKKIKDSTPNA